MYADNTSKGAVYLLQDSSIVPESENEMSESLGSPLAYLAKTTKANQNHSGS